MGNPLRILIVEDSKDDAELMTRELNRGESRAEVSVADNATDMKRLLASQEWDAIISDYALPSFGAIAALSVLRESGIDLPFIIVSGTIGEETAVEAMRAGAHDYIMKDNMRRLVPVIEREMREAESRRQRRESEDALRRSQKQYQSLVDSIEGIVWEADSTTRQFLFVSQRAESLLGYAAKRWLAEDQFFISLVHPDDRERFAQQMNDAARNIRECDFEYKTVAADGRLFWFRNIVSASSDDAGAVRLRGVMIDITSHKRAAEALRASEEKFSRVFRSSPQSIIISSLKEGRYIDVNDTFLESTGYTRDEIIGQTSTGLKVWPSPEERERFMKQIESRGIVRNFESRYRRKSGDYGVMLLSSEIIELEGEVCLLSVAADITERKKVEEKLLNIAEGISSTTGEEFFQYVVKHISETLEADFAFVGELSETHTDLATVIAIYGGGNLLDNFEYDLGNTPCKNVVNSTICSYPSGVQSQFEKDDMLKDLGIEGYVGTPLFDSSGKVLGLMAVLYRQPIKDVQLAESSLQIYATRVASELERKRAEERLQRTEDQLRQAQKMEAIGRLAGGVAHDFNNLLTAIIGYADVGMMKLTSGDPLRSILEEIIKAGERASTLTSQLLAFSRKQMLQLKVLDLNTVVSDMERMLKRLISEDIDLITIKGEQLGRVRVDRGQVEQVVMNLVINSRDAMPSGGTLTIETDNIFLDENYVSAHVDTLPGNYVRLSVSDTGHGMDEETIAHIFEPFYTTKAMGKGTGLGLSTVYGIIKQSGGDVCVKSEVGQGTTFNIFLPRIEQPEEEQEPRKPSARAKRGSETVLVVEDEDLVRRLTCQTLIINGYNVLEASNPGEALLICEQHKNPIDLLVTDVVMPQMNGRELSDRLIPLRPEMKVLYMSGYTDSVVYQQMDWSSGLTFIQKPFSPHNLLRKVRDLLDKN